MCAAFRLLLLGLVLMITGCARRPAAVGWDRCAVVQLDPAPDDGAVPCQAGWFYGSLGAGTGGLATLALGRLSTSTAGGDTAGGGTAGGDTAGGDTAGGDSAGAGATPPGQGGTAFVPLPDPGPATTGGGAVVQGGPSTAGASSHQPHGPPPGLHRPEAVPEAPSALVFGVALGALGLLRRRRPGQQRACVHPAGGLQRASLNRSVAGEADHRD